MLVKVRAEIKPTEDRDNVKLAILNIFPDVELVDDEHEIRGSTGSLERFMELIRNQRIRDSTRAQLFHARTESVIKIALNKQAAYMGKVSFGEHSPMGNIDMEIEDDDLEALIDRIAPRTSPPTREPKT